MKRRRFLAWFGLAPLAGAQDDFGAKAGASLLGEPCPIKIFVDKGPSLEITLPGYSKDSLIGIVSEFFGAGPKDSKMSTADQKRSTERIAKVMRDSKDITLTITTKCQR